MTTKFEMLGIDLGDSSRSRHRKKRLFTCIEIKPQPHHVFKDEMEVICRLSRDQAEELAKWLNRHLYGLKIDKAEDS